MAILKGRMEPPKGPVSARESQCLCLNGPVSLAGIAQWIERGPANQRVAGLIPRVGHMPGWQARSPVRGHMRGNHTLMFLSLSSSLPLSLKIKKIVKKHININKSKITINNIIRNKIGHHYK